MQPCHIVMCLQLHIVTYGCIPVSSSVETFRKTIKERDSQKVAQNSTKWFKVLGHIEMPHFLFKSDEIDEIIISFIRANFLAS